MNDLVKTIGDLAEPMSGLARQAVAEYAPVVGSIVNAQSRDIRHIEHTLDGLLDFCFDPEALLLYKKLISARQMVRADAAGLGRLWPRTGSMPGSAAQEGSRKPRPLPRRAHHLASAKGICTIDLQENPISSGTFTP